MTALPARSTTRVQGAVCAAIAASGPTAKIRSPATATACAIVDAASTVMTLPFLRMRSAGRAAELDDADEAVGEIPLCARAGAARLAPKVTPAAAFRKSRRFSSAMPISCCLLERDAEKWVPVFGKDHAPAIS